MNHFLGIDLGGTNIKVALVDEQGVILAAQSCPTPVARGASGICDAMAALCQSLLEKANGYVVGVGIGCPGTVDDDKGIVRYSNNLGWSNFMLRQEMEKRLGLPVRIANDANAAALGEALAGCAKQAHSAVILTLGTGVGGGVVLEKKLLTGYTGAGAELGHMAIVKDGEPCTCGRRGCLEAYASATALLRMTRQAMQDNPNSRMWHMGEITGKTAFDAARAGDAAAQRVVDTYIQHLAVGVANLINIFFPQVLGLSGGVANQGEELLVPLRKAVEPLVFGHAFAVKHTRIVACDLGYEAGMIGAALMAAEGRT